MACEMRVLVVHVHGQEADIESYFAAVEIALNEVENAARRMWPRLEILDGDLDLEDE